MKIYDISQEVFSCVVYPGDPAPAWQRVRSIGDGSPCNLTAFSMCAHNGTHVDAPFHFLPDGNTVEAIALQRTVGYAFVATHEGELSAEQTTAILQRAKQADPEAADHILLKGDVTVTQAAAEVLADAGILLIGVESQSVGQDDAPMAVHRTLLRRQVVLLEGIRLAQVPDGVYLLCAAPLALAGADGAPCRAVLVDLEHKE